MRVFFVTALSGLVVSEPLGRGDKLRNNDFVTNEPGAFEIHLDEAFRAGAGGLETEFILSSPTVVYAMDTLPDDADVQKYLVSKMLDLAAFLTSLWLIKDNAIDHGMLYASYPRGGGQCTESNYRATRLSRSSGDHEAVVYTRKELADARRLLRTHFGSYDFIPTSSAAAVQKGTRVARALYFISAARADSDLGLKIANYCSALEALFGTATSELTHLLAERVSVFLEEDPDPRIQIYQAVRRSYALRSSVIHGSQIKASKADTLRDAAKTLDDALRLALFKSASDTIRRGLLESTDALIDASFLRILMGCSWDDVGAMLDQRPPDDQGGG